MAYDEPFAASHEIKVDYSGSIILGLPNDVFTIVIFPKMCGDMDNATLLSYFHGWKLVYKGWKKVSCINVVWHVFQVNKVDVATSHWPDGEDIMPMPLSYDVWKRSLKVLQNKKTQGEKGPIPYVHP